MNNPKISQGFGTILLTLTGLFIFRVIAQPIQLIWETPYLPPYSDWASGALPYEILLPTQILLACLMLWIGFRVYQGRAPTSAAWQKFWQVFLLLYAIFVVMRTIGGLTFGRDMVFFIPKQNRFANFEAPNGGMDKESEVKKPQE